MNTAKDASVLLEQAIYGLLGQLPYYGCLIQSFKQVFMQSIPTAGVRFNGNCVELAINPDFFASLSQKERIALLIHEASHVDRLHLIRIPQATSNQRLGNIAADAAINCYIPNLPKGGIYPKDFLLKNYQTFEYYLERLTDNETETKQESPKKYVKPEIDSLDVHDWENSGLSVSDQAEVIENVMKRAIEKMGLDAGDLPAHVQESLLLLKELKTKKWHKDLKRFLGRTVNGFELERTWSRRNRRFGLLEAGTKVSGQKKLAIAFDTSGSMSSEELNQCLAETMAMVKTGVVGYLLQFDTKVNDIIRLKRSNLSEVEIHGRGGTSFKDLMAKVDELRCDGLVVFTDGADHDTCEKPKTPVLWVYTSDHESEKYNWGHKTTIA